MPQTTIILATAVRWKTPIPKFQPGGRSVKVERGVNSSFAEVYQAINGELWLLDHLYTLIYSPFTILSSLYYIPPISNIIVFFFLIKFQHYNLQIIFLKPYKILINIPRYFEMSNRNIYLNNFQGKIVSG